jgi:tetratricopeptide (TPR) repeat protein
MRRSAPLLALAAWLGSALGGCAAPRGPRLAYSPEELRAELAAREAPPPADEVVVPFEVTPQQVALARAAVGDRGSAAARAQRLSEALFSRQRFGLRYAWSVTGDAQETLRAGRGNCLALASVFVGLARGLGLEAYYMDASVEAQETRLGGDGVVVRAGHVTALVKDAGRDFGLDFAPEGRVTGYRVLSDVEALAHLYNNRGYDLLERAHDVGEPAPWAEVAHQFELAVAVDPGFAQAWSNLGIARARLGRGAEAEAAYRTAMTRDPRLAAPHNNLGLLLLEAGDAAGAERELAEAARLEPRGAHVQFNLATARLRRGDQAGAAAALRRALELRAAYPEAQALLTRIGADGGGR